MKHVLYIIVATLICSCGATNQPRHIENSESTPPPEGFVPLAPPVVIKGSPMDNMGEDR